jgi:fructose-bisphosphate aldolase, class II
MPLVSMKDMLNKALTEKYAVGQFNINNLEWTQAILAAAQEEKSPVILGVSEGAARYMGGFNTVVHIVKGLLEDMRITVPVAIHLDHGSSFEKCQDAIRAGFTSVMIDASHHPFKDNVEITKKVVEYAHELGISVEAELGTVGGQEDDVVADGVIYADPEECKKLVELTGIDCLAPALGSVHGPYKGDPKLGFKEMELVREQHENTACFAWRNWHSNRANPTFHFSWHLQNRRQYRKSNCLHEGITRGIILQRNGL